MVSLLNDNNKANFSIELNERHYDLFYIYNNITILQDHVIIKMITTLLIEILQETDLIKKYKISKFNSKFKPPITLQDYLLRLGKCFQCSQECFILALIYIDRITEFSTYFIVNSLNVHRILLMSIAIAAKFYDEKYFTNQYYAKVGGISLKEFNCLEVEFLTMINYKLYVEDQIFIQYREKLSLYE